MKLIFGIAVIFASLIALSSGARYLGTTATEAGRILDKSQGKVPFGFAAEGHPRGHALATGPLTGSNIGSLQEFSKFEPQSTKTGFRSRDDQNKVVHLALLHRSCQFQLFVLNFIEKKRQSCTVPANAILSTPLTVEEWKNGARVRTGNMRLVTIVMGHFQREENNLFADVHIHTAYPAL